MEITAYRLLYGNIHDFKMTAMHVESEISRYGIRSVGATGVPLALADRGQGQKGIEIRIQSPVHSSFRATRSREVRVSSLLKVVCSESRTSSA